MDLDLWHGTAARRDRAGWAPRGLGIVSGARTLAELDLGRDEVSRAPDDDHRNTSLTNNKTLRL